MNANEPAFPFHYKDRLPSTGEETTREQWSGITKREYFAAMAMQGLSSSKSTALDDAKMAVALADALLAELDRTEPKEAR